MAVHTVRVGLFTVDQIGNRLDKSRGNHSIASMLNTRQEALVIPDAGIPTTAGYPTIKAYLEAESG